MNCHAGIVWHSSTLPNAIHLAETGYNFIIKRPTLITMDLGQNSKNTEPFLYKDLGHGERLLIWSYKSLTIFGKGICENKNVLFAPLRWISLCKVYTQQLQGLVCYQIILDCFGLIIVSLSILDTIDTGKPRIRHPRTW